MLWGFFQKLMIADRAAIAVNAVYNQYQVFGGGEILLATILFAFQIYCDFDAYTNIASGAAKICGFDLMANFRQPYFATSIADFWRRWHISLSSWFRDYLYIPLGGSRVSAVRIAVESAPPLFTGNAPKAFITELRTGILKSSALPMYFTGFLIAATITIGSAKHV
jgi:D-alanyl-lipoteichoic acid acyltransferase DltB (MBOAT superfamily)